MSQGPRARSVPEAAPTRPPILVLTRIWPTARRPSLGSFIRSRAAGVADVRVVHPRWPGMPTPIVYAVLLVDALRVTSRIRGVEAHMLIPTGIVGLLVARLRRVPLVVYAHGRDVRRWQAHPPPIRWLARLVATRADRLVTNSEDTAAAIRKLGGSAQVAPPGVDLRRFGPTPRPAERRVLYLGGRNRRKGYAVAARLADTLVGPWLRDVDPDEVPALIAAHDVVLVPSVAEPFGLVAVEAIACGRWVVASAVGGLRNIVVDGVNGTLVGDGDFAGALARVPDYDPHEVARTAQRFSLERWQATLADIWDEVAPLQPQAAGRGEPARGHHVAMLLRNTYTHDTRVEQEARTLLAAGYRVTVVADAAAGLPAREWREGIEVLRVARRGPRVWGLRFVLHEARLSHALRALRPDVLHAHDSNTLIAVAWAARALGVAFVYDAHDLWLGRPRRERSRAYFGLSQAFYTLVEWWLMPRAAVTITVSDPIARHLQHRYRLGRVHLVPNYPEIAGPVAANELRSLPGGTAIGTRGPLVLYLGGLMGGRGLEQLVDALRFAGSMQLIILGSGRLASELARRAAALGAGDRLHLLAPVGPNEVIAYAASADIGVSPIVPSCLNYRYSLPNKLFQYMAAGIPVVASDFPQVRDVVEGARCGLVVDTTRPEAIAAAIERLAGEPGEARAMGRRGRAAVEERYNWSTSAAVLLQAYAGLNAHPRATGRAMVETPDGGQT